MRATINELDPHTAPESDLRGYYDVTEGVFEHDKSTLVMPPFESLVEFLRTRTSMLGPRRFWLARHDDRVIGLAIASFPQAENTGQVMVDIRVLPSERRQGVGTALLHTILPALADEGRHYVSGDVAVGGDGEKWSAACGFAKVHEVVDQELLIPDTDPQRWQVPPPAGYRVQRWIGAAPEDVVASYARARGAMSDAPTGDSSYQSPNWTVERVRHAEAEASARGSEIHVVVAVTETDGEIVALTEMEIPSLGTDQGFQMDTAVVPSHRGHRLGRFVKAEMLRWLTAERPSIKRIVTSNAAENVHMIRINSEIGFTVSVAQAVVEADISALRSRLDA